MANKFITKLFSGYRFAALMAVNTLVALMVLNLFFFAVFSARDHFRRNPVSTKYGHSAVSLAYPGLNESEIDTLLTETWSRRYIYEPFTQFKERPYQGSYVNVDTNGFRKTKHQGTWPPQRGKLNIFLFGGSTMFGYGVADDQTVASYLQASLTTKLNRAVCVYNFGRGDYYSTQERILYESILTSGVVPDVALFVDGLNDFYYNSNEPMYTSRFRKFAEQGKASAIDIFSRTSLARAVRGLRNRFAKLIQEDQYSERRNDKMRADLNATSKYADPKVLDAVIQRYLLNKRLIEAASASFGVAPIFVWQPVPTYHCDQHHHPFSEGGYGNHSYSQYGYERMAELLKETPLGDNFLWCADIQKSKTVPLYVDKVHYSDSFSKELALEIANLMINRSLVVETD